MPHEGSSDVRFVVVLFLPLLSDAGEIRLSVKDSSGPPMAAGGTVASIAIGEEVAFRTDAAGAFIFRSRRAGRYRLRVTKPGFTDEYRLVTLPSTGTINLEVKLGVGPAATSISVVATTPLAGTSVTREELPVTAQSSNAQDLERSGAIHLADFLNQRLSGIFVNEIQGNPFQPDVNYRGYTASPLLGTPQGLSVYMDGVRLNQPFGDVMSWDLVPRVAIREITVIPGSNPLFGLNTLGGALAVETKSGLTEPDTSIQVSGGSFGRKVAEFQHGGVHRRGFDWYLAGNLFFEDGWRQASPSNVRQLFSKFGWKTSKNQVSLSVSYANNLLNGNGLQETRLLARDYHSAYTLHDATRNRSPLLNLTARRIVSPSFSFAGNAYYRSIQTASFNGDINQDSFDQPLYQPSAVERAALAAAGYTGYPTAGASAANTAFPYWRCLANVLLRDQPDARCNGLVNRTQSHQRNYGAAGQGTWVTTGGTLSNQVITGAAWDRSQVDFAQSSEFGYLNPDHSITGTGLLADGADGGSVDLAGHIQTASIYATDTLTAGALSLTASGRFNRTLIENRDRLLPSGTGSLTGRHVFRRFNPAIGATYRLTHGSSGYGNYSEGSRAPTSIELGCADPVTPCKLPNAMAGDPPLRQVVTRTLEAGLRSRTSEASLSWNLGWFRASNRDDILFIASPQSGFGYFKNFCRTRRQGMEAAVNGHLGRRVTLGANYLFLNASFESPETVLGAGNSKNNAVAKGLQGLIRIVPGNQIPLSPQHTAKANAAIDVTRKLTVDLSGISLSSAYARGNENNLHQPDGTYYLGTGKSPAYIVFHAGAHYAIHRRMQLFIQVNNLLDRRYFSAAQLGPSGFSAQGIFQARSLPAASGQFPVPQTTFLAPGAPRAAWAGLRIRF